MWPGLEEERVLVSGRVKRSPAGLRGQSREVSEEADPDEVVHYTQNTKPV